MQHCRLVFGPPNFGLSRQLMHLAQSSTTRQPLQSPQRRERIPPGVYWLRIFLLPNLWHLLLPLLRMFSWETTHWALPWSAMSSSSSATSASKKRKGWAQDSKKPFHNIIKCEVGRHLCMPELTIQSAGVYLLWLKVFITSFSLSIAVFFSPNNQAWVLHVQVTNGVL